jgi:hypothetical protein
MKYIQYDSQTGRIFSINDFQALVLPQGVFQMAINDETNLDNMKVNIGTNTFVEADFILPPEPPGVN